MQYIDGPNFSNTKPSCASGSASPQYFKNCSAPGANDGTVITADWLNDVQGNILEVLNAAGIAPTPCRDEDLKDAISLLITNSLQNIPLSAISGTGLANQNASFDINGNLVATPFPIIPSAVNYISIGDVKYSYQAANHENWLLADGSTFSATDFPDLANLVGGTTLPDLRGLTTVGAGTGTYVAGLTNKPLGSTGGEERHQLTVNETPAHEHLMFSPSASTGGDISSPNHYVARVRSVGQGGLTNENFEYDMGRGNNPPTLGRTNSVGGNQAHNNMQPYIALNPFIFAGA